METLPLPKRADLTGLPRWAVVAFATRCARRARLYKFLGAIEASAPWISKTSLAKEHASLLAKIDEWLTTAQRAATEGTADKQRAHEISRRLNEPFTGVQPKMGMTWHESAANAIRAVEMACASARAAYLDEPGVQPGDNAIRAAAAASAALEHSGYQQYEGDARENMLEDIARLRTLAREEKWSEDTPVSPTKPGGLWSGEVPEGLDEI